MLVVFTFLFVLFGVMSGASVNMKAGAIPSPWIFYTIPVFGTAAAYYLSACLDGVPKISGMLAWLGRNSLLIMCLHEPIKRIVIKICAVLAHSETDILRESDLVSLFMAVITVAVCVPFVIVISKHLQWMTGRKRSCKPSVSTQSLDENEKAGT